MWFATHRYIALVEYDSLPQSTVNVILLVGNIMISETPVSFVCQGFYLNTRVISGFFRIGNVSVII
jgi:hypothetical protein